MTTTEKHPWEPFLPSNAKVLILGSFPPPRIRWSMDFYYPNITNDFWKMIGLLFFNDKEHFIIKETKKFKELEIKIFLAKEGIALYDTATEVIRKRGNAADAHLEITRATDIASLLKKIPVCQTIIVTGEKAAECLLAVHGRKPPKTGESMQLLYGNREITLWRLPSTSRAYPIALEKKADSYRKAFTEAGIKVPF